MKILYVVEASFAGVGRHVSYLVAGMAGRGHEVHVAYSPRRADDPFLADLAACTAVSRSLALPMHRAPHPADLVAVARLARYASRHGPFDIIHGISSKGGALARLAGLLNRTPVCYSPQAFVTMSSQIGPTTRVLYRWVERWLARLTTKVIVVSDLERRHAAGLGIAPARLAQIPNGIAPFSNADRPALRASFGVAPGTLAIGFIGRLEDQKAPDLLVEAVALMPPGMPDHRFLVVGSGSHEQGLKAMAQRLGVADKITWLGTRSRDAILAFDVFVMTSDYEGFPYVLLEALQIGLPIVVTPVGGARETVRHLENGLVVPHRDAPTLAKSIAFILGDADRRARMGQASRDLAANFSLDEMYGRLEATYRQCLVESGRQSDLQPAVS